MANGERGGVTEEMRRMARDFNRNAEKLGEIIKELNNRTVNSDKIWKGPAADQFRSEWNDARGTFQNMRKALDDAGSAVTKNAENLERVTDRR
jgi:WXG100 family type VII secretion target